ncbi:LytTR family DNA-binding domain-containing protein [Sphingosinicella sp. CPCC 101087]|uniref:LytTR family DNA-binding domain-containing protein n=1 Tax=Sphingosinicella sp. CPCC 101087 TaxID=2497754 RepID=UPI001981F446|nr:LytTR family DNA-binding domain-containing protein [Sphingosinicella sp. CPCC 101087]
MNRISAAWARRPRPGIVADLGLLLVIALFLGVTGPYGTAREPVAARHLFWLFTIVAGGLIGLGIAAALRSRIRDRWVRALVAAGAMTPPVAFLVLAAMVLVLRHDHGFSGMIYLDLLWQVFVIALAMMSLLTLLRRPPRRIVETRTVIAPPLPHAEARFRRRLSAGRRTAALLALEAHDHYVRVHTDAGIELISLRFSDALAELSGAHGFRVHRSWWVSAEAIKAARWRRASGELELTDGSIVPISRSGAPALRSAGWL